MDLLKNFNSLNKEDFNFKYWYSGFFLVIIVSPVLLFKFGLVYAIISFICGNWALIKSVNTKKLFKD